MIGKPLFDDVSLQCSKMTTKAYSTSFSIGIRTLAKELRDPIYAIYGFVRFADEIVDTFHGFDKKFLLEKFKQDTIQAIDQRISLNPILNAFQFTFHKYNLDWKEVETFLNSMEMDLEDVTYQRENYEQYILGSAEVVGLMCLHVFVEGNNAEFERLKPSAMRLGAAFQKINFLRDIQADFHELGRTYFPGVNLADFNTDEKKKIEKEIAEDFKVAYAGILQLPKKARFGVLIAYTYYYRLFHQIQLLPSERILKERISVPNPKKFLLLAKSYLKHNLNLL